MMGEEMVRTRNAMAAGLLLAIVAGIARAASPYDGKWMGTAPEAGDCGVLTVTLFVKDGSITGGTVSGKHGSPTVHPAAIAQDGLVTLTYGPFQATARLAGAQFTGNFQTFCGTRAVTGAQSP